MRHDYSSSRQNRFVRSAQIILSDKSAMNSIKVLYACLFVCTLSTISWTLHLYPLFPLQTDSAEWLKTWLAATVVDYYGSTLCLCGVILSTADSWWAGILWCVGCCLLGSPVSCAWILYQIWGLKRSLRLADANSRGNSGDEGGHLL